MRAATLIMNDDVEGAEAGLKQGNSSFHKLGRGVVTFLRATLGLEQDVMREASERLADAETTALNDHYKAQRRDGGFHSSIYALGSEFSLVAAEAQMMSAVVGVLNESLTESIKGFYKLRKAFATLDALIGMEQKYMKGRHSSLLLKENKASKESLGVNLANGKESQVKYSSEQLRASNIDTKSSSDPKSPTNLHENMEEENDEDDFFDADETRNDAGQRESYEGHLVVAATQDVAKMSMQDETDREADQAGEHASYSLHHPSTTLAMAEDKSNAIGALIADPGSEILANPVDSFIHSGCNLCFGLLNVLISIIPPAFGRLLSIIGFRGDRENGLQLLWQASKFENINGGMAGLALLGWYNGLVGFCDILPDPRDSGGDIAGYPLERLKGLLSVQRTRFPKSQLWLLEEARMESAQRRLDQSLDLLSQPAKTPLKQVEALHMFEKSLNSMYAHRYDLCTKSFLTCADLNSWSRALYYFIAGAAKVAQYRQTKDDDPQTARKYAEEAQDHIRKAPTQAGKRKMLGKQLPFDQYVGRKVAKWEARAKDWHCDLIDAIGVSPIEEMIFVWGGFKRMNKEQLENSLQNLAWSEDRARNEFWDREELDEHAILAVLRATVYRELRQHQKAKEILQSAIISHDRHLFKGYLKDDWTCPVAHYEMAVNLWMERTGYVKQYGRQLASRAVEANHDTGVGEKARIDIDLEYDRKCVSECKSWLDKASNWDSYLLDTRFGTRITVGQDSVKKWEAQYGL